MASISEEIIAKWDGLQSDHALEIDSMSDSSYRAWVIKIPDARNGGELFGVAIQSPPELTVYEEFANVRLRTHEIKNILDSKSSFLILISPDASAAFAALCAEFIAPGENGSHRESVLSDPIGWWREWKSLLGNKNVDMRVYDVLGELVVLDKIHERGFRPRWTGPEGGATDIDCGPLRFEVKSTTTRDSKLVQIHGLFQLADRGTQKYLVHVRFEPSVQGLSIDAVVDRLVSAYKLKRGPLEKMLDGLGYPSGSSARSVCYDLLELALYKVDESFPHIDVASFVGGVLPVGVASLNSYTISLDGIESIDLDDVLAESR